MKSITIHGIEEEIEKMIKKRAKSEGMSVNKVVKGLLAKALGVYRNKKDNREEFLDLFGIWTEDTEKRFFEAIEDLERVFPEDWK